MKIQNLILLLLITMNLFSQNYPEKTKHIKTIYSTVYYKNDTLKHRKLITYYDKDWNVLTNTNTLSSALRKGSKTVTIIDTKHKLVKAVLTPQKDTLDYIVYIFDNNGNRTHNYQIRKGDTLVSQLRKYDKEGNNTELYNKKNGKYYLSFRAEYNSENKLTIRRWYNSKNVLTRTYKVEYSKDGKTKKYYQTNRNGVYKLQRKEVEIEPKKFKIQFYKDARGINYGIPIIKKKGYFSIEKYNEKNNLISLEIFDKKRRLQTSVYVEYEELITD